MGLSVVISGVQSDVFAPISAPVSLALTGNSNPLEVQYKTIMFKKSGGIGVAQPLFTEALIQTIMAQLAWRPVLDINVNKIYFYDFDTHPTFNFANGNYDLTIHQDAVTVNDAAGSSVNSVQFANDCFNLGAGSGQPFVSLVSVSWLLFNRPPGFTLNLTRIGSEAIPGGGGVLADNRYFSGSRIFALYQQEGFTFHVLDATDLVLGTLSTQTPLADQSGVPAGSYLEVPIPNIQLYTVQVPDPRTNDTSGMDYTVGGEQNMAVLQ